MKSKYRMYFDVVIDESGNTSNENFDLAQEIFCDLDDIIRDTLYKYKGDFDIVEEDEE